MEKIYRFKFSKETQEELENFSYKHRYDDIPTFRDNWSIWYKNNIKIAKKEEEYLRNLGYKKDIELKMYTSVRYYLKNKCLTRCNPKTRRKYIRLPKEFLELIRLHLDESILKNILKPSEAYNNFVTDNKYKEKVYKIREKLKEKYKLSDAAIEIKLKKMYKNKYYRKQKNI